MGFQPAVFLQCGAGVPGEMYNTYPHQAASYIINSGSAANNIIGSTVCTITSQSAVEPGNVGQNIIAAGGTGIFAGFLVDPKNIALFGTGGAPLAPTLVVPNFTQVECLTMGSIWVTLPAAAAIGDVVIFSQATGQISTITPTTAVPGGSTYANAVVSFFPVAGAGLAVVTVDPQQNPYVHQ